MNEKDIWIIFLIVCGLISIALSVYVLFTPMYELGVDINSTLSFADCIFYDCG